MSHSRHSASRTTVFFASWLLVLAILAAGCATGVRAESTSPSFAPLLDNTADSDPDRDPFLWPFAVDSPWNTPIGDKAEFAESTHPTTGSLLDPSVSLWLNFDEWSHPVVLANPADSVVTVRYDNSNIVPFGPGSVDVAIPDEAQPAVGTDAHLHIVDADGVTAREFFGLNLDSREATASYYVENDLRGLGIGNGGTRAYGGSALGGLIRAWELESRDIRHALAIALVGDQLQQGPLWPAVAQDESAGRTYKGPVQIGSLLAIPPWVDVDAMFLTPSGTAVAAALQRYGAYVVDQANAVTFYAEPSVSAADVRAIRKDLRRIRSELRVVTNNTEATPGGGGLPIAPSAPPLS